MVQPKSLRKSMVERLIPFGNSCGGGLGGAACRFLVSGSNTHACHLGLLGRNGMKGCGVNPDQLEIKVA